METIFDLTDDAIINLSERYLIELEEAAITEAECIAMNAMAQLYALGKIDFYIDVNEFEPRNRLKFVPNEPS
jgi:hypothetical protein